VYVNNTAIKSRPTNKSLPTGEFLNGKKSYQQIVSYFTTNTMSPDEIHDLGFKMLKNLYPQVGDVILKICDYELLELVLFVAKNEHEGNRIDL